MSPFHQKMGFIRAVFIFCTAIFVTQQDDNGLLLNFSLGNSHYAGNTKPDFILNKKRQLNKQTKQLLSFDSHFIAVELLREKNLCIINTIFEKRYKNSCESFSRALQSSCYCFSITSHSQEASKQVSRRVLYTPYRGEVWKSTEDIIRFTIARG